MISHLITCEKFNKMDDSSVGGGPPKKRKTQMTLADILKRKKEKDSRKFQIEMKSISVNLVH